jgi:hypothetical protein
VHHLVAAQKIGLRGFTRGDDLSNLGGMDLPLHTARLTERRLAQYCERVCPPSFGRQVRLAYRLEGRIATLYEIKPAWCTLSDVAHRDCDVARFIYEPRDGSWRFQYHERSRRWRSYRRLPRSRDFLALLREIDADPAGIFWGRVNGASLRWCSSRGRCPQCDQRYRSILGLVDTVAVPDILAADTACWRR